MLYSENSKAIMKEQTHLYRHRSTLTAGCCNMGAESKEAYTNTSEDLAKAINKCRNFISWYSQELPGWPSQQEIWSFTVTSTVQSHKGHLI